MKHVTLTAALLTIALSTACGSTDDQNQTTPSGSQDAGTDATPEEDAPAADATDEMAEVDASGGADAAVELSTADQLALYLTGRFDSEAQSQQDVSYYAIQLIMCPVDVPELGVRVLYVEQAQMAKPSQPYRQRLYVVEPGDAPDTAVSNIYELANPAAVVGLCDDPASLTLTADDATEKVGCAVLMQWKGDHFEGGTQGKDCASDLNGASYATSEVVLDETTLTSWDRGLDAQDEQVWGAVSGPYVFDRKTTLSK